MTLKNTALLTGLVRDPALYRERVDMLLAWRAENIIDDIVVSTWLHELSAHGSLREDMIAAGIRVIEVSPPEIGYRGHAWHQMKTLAFGLDACEPGSAVYKLRGDKIPVSGQMKDALAKRALTPAVAPPGWPTTLRYKIKTAGGIVTQPFFLNDMVFYGLREDLYQLINFDMSMSMSGAVMNVEQLFYIAPFARFFPIFHQFFRVNWGLLHFDHQYDMSRALISGSMTYPFYQKVMLTWFLLLRGYFEASYVEESRFDKEVYKDWTLEDFFDIACQRQRPGVDYGESIKTLNFNDLGFVDAALTNGFASSKLADDFLRILDDVTDYKKQAAYGHLYLGLEPEALRWAEFTRSHPVGDMNIAHLKPVSEALWQVQTPPLHLKPVG